MPGKLCRRILKNFQFLCRMDPRLRSEELPPISDISDSDEDFPAQEPRRNVCALFTGQRRESVVHSEFTSMSRTVHEEVAAPVHIASSTVVEDLPNHLPSDCSEDVCSSPGSQSSVSVELTPPPPTPCMPRGGGRPKKTVINDDHVLSGPSQPRKRGRPRKVVAEEAPPAKRGRGRPKRMI